MRQAARESEPRWADVMEELDNVFLLLGGLGDDGDENNKLEEYKIRGRGGGA